MQEGARLIVLAYSLYTSSEAFFALGTRWFPDLQANEDTKRTVATMQRKFWHSAFGIAVFLSVALLLQHHLGLLDPPPVGYALRLSGVALALQAALGRGGWSIQTWKGTTIPERIDRGMYVVSQLGAVAILLFVLTL